MPDISGGGLAITPYTPNIMLDVPAGILVSNAATGAGTEVYAANVGTRYVVDWATIPNPVSFTRIQVVGKVGTAGTVVVKIRDVTNGIDIVTASITSSAASVLVAGNWTPFTMPTTPVTYAVFCQGDGVMDPTLYSALWEWR